MSRIVVNGTFDVLHRGHIELLHHAALLGSYVLVCIDSDDRVKQLKGSTRPINTQEDRKVVLQSLRSVDSVAIFTTDDDLRRILWNYRPDIMVKGSDWRDKSIVGSEYCSQILFYDRMEPYSSTRTVAAMNSSTADFTKY